MDFLVTDLKSYLLFVMVFLYAYAGSFLKCACVFYDRLLIYS